MRERSDIRRLIAPMTSGRLDFHYELLPQNAQCSVDVTRRGSVRWIEHAPDGLFIRAGKYRKCGAREAAVAESQGQCRFGGHAGRHGNSMFAGPLRTRRRDVVTALDTPGDRLLQGIGSFKERSGFIGTGSEAFRQIAERYDDFTGAIGPEAREVDEVHDTTPQCALYRKSSRLRRQLANHRGKLAGSYLLASILHDGETLTIVQSDMTSPTASGINMHRDTTVEPDVSNPVDKSLPFT